MIRVGTGILVACGLQPTAYGFSAFGLSVAYGLSTMAYRYFR
jgi:hypothetical protein